MTLLQLSWKKISSVFTSVQWITADLCPPIIMGMEGPPQTSTEMSGKSLSLSSTNFIATQVLNKTSGPLCVTYYTTAVMSVVDSLHCRMICGTVPSSVNAWMPPATAATWLPAAAHSKPLSRQQGRHDRRWSCATTVEHAATVTMQIADAYVTRCRRPAVAHCRDNVVLCRSYNGKL